MLRAKGDPMRDESRPPSLETDAEGRLRLLGSWTLVHAGGMAEQLRLAPEAVEAVARLEKLTGSSGRGEKK